MIRPLKMLHDGRADIAFAQPNHVRHERPAKIPRHLHSLPDRNLLKIGKLLRNFVVPQNVLVVLAFEPVPHQRVERLHVHVVRARR